jgi:cell division protein FtsB
VKDVSSEQIGSALRRLAQDLVTERHRVAQLERENRALRAQLEALQGESGASGAPARRRGGAEEPGRMIT